MRTTGDTDAVECRATATRLQSLSPQSLMKTDDDTAATTGSNANEADSVAKEDPSTDERQTAGPVYASGGGGARGPSSSNAVNYNPLRGLASLPKLHYAYPVRSPPVSHTCISYILRHGFIALALFVVPKQEIHTGARRFLQQRPAISRWLDDRLCTCLLLTS